jgi:hypothetical protein
MKGIKYNLELLMQINAEMIEKVNEYIDACITNNLDINLERVNNIMKYFVNLKTDIVNQFLNFN